MKRLFELVTHELKQITNLEWELKIHQDRAKDNSIRALYVAILQIEKQGISFVHGKNIPTIITEPKSGEPIHNIIWYGRNQSMHYEEGKYQKPEISCFGNLQQAFGSDFDLTIGDNKAKYIVLHVLEWRTYSDYLTTMSRLLP